VRDVAGCGALQGRHERPRARELRVVVVLDHQAVAGRGPGQQGGAPLRAELDTGRVLVGRRDQHRPRPGPLERRDVDALASTGTSTIRSP
jgi:hypothetical protein